MAHILLIDDDEFFRGMLRLTLLKMGHKVTEAKNGRSGLALHACVDFDLVITDLIMPEKEGIETIIEVLRRTPEIPIIAMTGGGRTFDDEHLLHIASRVGARELLSKPFTPEALAAAIVRAID